ncbi:MAG: hypothetical protein M3Y91_15880 [Actinomycetota bacterium]|nr:hypothetical protein [Actinomycetota bacterium]
MNRVILILHRLRLLDTRASLIRVVAWTAVSVVVISQVVAPTGPRYTDRKTPPDNPISAVRYVAPLNKTDLSGFLPPPHNPKAFTIAWIGGSETKLDSVSVPGEVSRRIAKVGNRPVLVDSYNLVAPRTFDAYLALRAAITSKADAIVMTVNPVWFTPQWSAHDWPNLDVSDPLAFAHQVSTAPWLVSSVPPSDFSWAALRATLPLLRQQTPINVKLGDAIDNVGVLGKPATPLPAPLPPKPFRPFETDFWLSQYLGGAPVDQDTPQQSIGRLAVLLQGMNGIDDRALGERYVKLLLSEAASSGRPTYVYSNPLSFAGLADPTLGPLATHYEQRLAALAAETKSPNMVVQSQSVTRDMTPDPNLFVDVAHMSTAGPLADTLTPKLCDALVHINPALACTTSPVAVGS